MASSSVAVHEEPSPVAPYNKEAFKMRKAAPYPLDGDERIQFVRGKWEVQLNDYRIHCVPNGWMVCCLPCVSIAQISVRMGTDAYGAALAKQLVYNLLVWGVLAVELVFCVRYYQSLSSARHGEPWTSLAVIFAACVVVIGLSIVWAKSLIKLRAQVRERFEIDGTPSDDKYAITWCTPCAIAQMATQVKSYTPGSCDFRAPDALPAYIV